MTEPTPRQESPPEEQPAVSPVDESTGGSGAAEQAAPGGAAADGGSSDGATSRPKPTYAEGGPGASAEPGGDDEYDHAPEAAGSGTGTSEGDALAEEDTMAASLLADLQRLQAEYVNYKKRVDRDRDVIRATAVSGVVEALLPVLDDIFSARQAGALDSGPFAAIADKLEGILERLGIVRVGEPGEEFDPTIHEAMVHVEAELPESATGTTVVQVFQPGYKNGDRLVRAARVSVADPA